MKRYRLRDDQFARIGNVSDITLDDRLWWGESWYSIGATYQRMKDQLDKVLPILGDLPESAEKQQTLLILSNCTCKSKWRLALPKSLTEMCRNAAHSQVPTMTALGKGFNPSRIRADDAHGHAG
jgi:hypothetical protein